MAADQSTRRLGWLSASALVLLALTGMEWWTTSQLGLLIVPAGVLSGMALLGGLLLLSLVFRIARGEWAAAVVSALLAVTELALGGAVVAVLAGLAVLMLPAPVSAQIFQGDAATDLVLFTLVGLALFVAARSWSRYARQKTEVAQASLQAAQARSEVAEREKELALSQLMVLRAQVEPHFLWNTLAHVQYLIRKNPDDAGRMTGHLIHYLRAAVPQMRGDVSTLGTEMGSVRAYLELMKIRMGERLTVVVDLPADLEALPFAPLLIQTLVENAIKHGVEPKVGPVSVTVRAQADADAGGQLRVEVQDNGVGLQAAPNTRGTGLGLRSVRDRLKLLYGEPASLSIAGAPGGGVLARMVIPHGAAPLV
jgi:sensor histidine kinase YesM